ncbi:MAG: peptide ABC transporter substrate-binding protein [Candidatus Hydrogenedentes bacterium]|nr:peptide ABC transporter substrate-binding protein [Candidatus Hydrogenedentota bacterium]
MALALALGAGCSKTETPAVRAAREGVLLVGNGAEPQALDPHLVTGVPEHRIATALFEGLCDLDPATLEAVPAVAESWAVSDDGCVYTFTLRPDAKWSNGDAVTADDFAYAWERILSPALASEYAYMLHCIKNAKAFNEGELDAFGQVGVRVVDARTLEVTLEEPTPYFLEMQIHYTWFPLHRATIEQFGGMTERGTKWTRPGNLVGNGAFTLERWEPNRVLRVVKNDHYWNADAVRLSAVEFHPIEDTLTEERSFRTGNLHLTENVPISKIEGYQRDTPGLIRIDPYYGSYYYRLNVTRPPFDDVRVRRAFAMAVDRDTLVARVVRAGRRPAGNLTPPDPSGYTCAASIPYDVEAARALLAEAGYPNGEGFPPTELLYNTSENHKLIAEAVQQMWKDNLNVHVALLNQDWKVYLSSMSTLDYQMARSAWIGDFVDPINFLECFVTGGGNNRTGWASPAYDALIGEARRTLDAGQRMAVLEKAERVLLDEAPIIPVYFYTRVFLIAPELRGVESNLLGYINFKRLWFEPEARAEG